MDNTVQQPATRTIYWPTNHNNKLACSAMVHIDLAPRKRVLESEMEKTIIEIRTQDNSFPFSQWKLIDMLRMPLQRISALITMTSHGMYSFDFVKWFLEKNEGANLDTEIAVYYYMRYEGSSGE